MAGHEGPRCVAMALAITVKVDDARASTDECVPWAFKEKYSGDVRCESLRVSFALALRVYGFKPQFRN